MRGRPFHKYGDVKPEKIRIRKPRKTPTDLFLELVEKLQLPAPTPEHKFMKTRRFQFDFVWEDLKVAVEIEGAVFARGRHVRGTGYSKDCEKYNYAALLGWTLLRFTSPLLRKGIAERQLQMIFDKSLIDKL